MRLSEYLDIKQAVIEAGYAHDIDWAQTVAAPVDADAFATALVYVICNSGMRAQVARQIFERIMVELRAGRKVTRRVFGHKGKVAAIEDLWARREELLTQYRAAPDKVAFLAGVKFIGKITKWHAAKNLGADVMKPDRHLVRIADRYQLTPHELCQRLADATGDRIGTVDVVLWRAANLGIIRTR